MSTSAKTWKMNFRANGDGTILGRLTARNGSGAATGVAGEGNFVKQADVSAIVANAYDMTAAPTTPVALTISTSAVIDTPVTTTTLWTYDGTVGPVTGYNFLLDIPAAIFTNSGHDYRIEVKVTLSGGAVAWGIGEGTAQGTQGS